MAYPVLIIQVIILGVIVLAALVFFTKQERREKENQKSFGSRRPDEETGERTSGHSGRAGAGQSDDVAPEEGGPTLEMCLAVLGLTPGQATMKTIEKAYRRAALSNHPDKNPDDPFAHERFKLIGDAYETLVRHIRQ